MPNQAEAHPHSEGQPKDLLTKWIETGYSQSTVAMYGCSQEELRSFLRQGFLTPHFSSNDETGEYRYYTLAADQNLSDDDTQQSNIHDVLFDRYSTDEQREFSKYSNLEQQLMTARAYALTHAVGNYIEEHVRAYGVTEKVDIAEVMQLASELLTEERFTQVMTEIDEAGYTWSGEFNSPNLELVQKIRSVVDQKELIDLLEKALNRRGVLLFFSSEIFTAATPLLDDFEDEAELNFSSTRPLPLHVISGVQVLTASEQTELLAS